MRKILVEEFDYSDLPTLLRDMTDWFEEVEPKVWGLNFEPAQDEDCDNKKWGGIFFVFRSHRKSPPNKRLEPTPETGVLEQSSNRKDTINRSNDEEIINIVRSVLDNGVGKAETPNEHILIKLMQLRGTPITSFAFDQDRVDFYYNQYYGETGATPCID